MAKIESDTPSAKTLWIKAADGQTEDILDVQTHDGVSYFKIDKDGNIYINSIIGLEFLVDGGGTTIQTGSKGYVEMPFGGTITGWTLLADVTGSIVVDVKKCTYTNFPTTLSIAGSEKPTLSSAQKNQDLSLTTWTTTVSSGDILEFYVDSVSTITKITLSLRINRNV